MSALQENQVTDVGSNSSIPASTRIAQTFTPVAVHSLDKVSLYVSSTTSGRTFRVQIWSTDGDGKPDVELEGINVTTDSLPGTATWVDFDFPTSVPLTVGTKYAIVFYTTGGAASFTYHFSTGAGPYANGNRLTSPDEGANWNILTKDAGFREYGDKDFSPPNDKVAFKRLVAFVNDNTKTGTIFYGGTGSGADSFTELSGVAGNIDVTDQLEAAAASQKVFVANGSNLGVADFVNIKITTANVGANPPDYGTILTGGTSGASMIVDYITTLSSACVIYGYNTTSNTFSSGETITGTDNDSNAISFATNSAETSGPFWYNWTPFGDAAGAGTNLGSLPSQAYLIAHYRGRLVLAGNPEYPHQWYMSRQSNPWDWEYAANDAQAAVAGSNADANEVGDIVRCIIPYKDDYIIFGCAKSIWVLRGDAASGGSMDEISLVTGMFGAASFCWDDKDNLYFMGNDGVYLLPPGFGPPAPSTGRPLPRAPP